MKQENFALGQPTLDDPFRSINPQDNRQRIVPKRPNFAGALNESDLQFGLKVRLHLGRCTEVVVVVSEVFPANLGGDKYVYVTTPQQFDRLSESQRRGHKVDLGLCHKQSLASAGIIPFPGGWHSENYAEKA